MLLTCNCFADITRGKTETGKGTTSFSHWRLVHAHIKGVWWINRESANISQIKVRRPYAALYRNGWAWHASNGKIEAKLTAPRTSISPEEYEAIL